MENNQTEFQKFQRLRELAEKLVEQNPGSAGYNISLDVQALIHDLEVYQVELRVQNEELQRAQLELQKMRNRYNNLYDFAPAGLFSLDKDNRIIEVNLLGASMLGTNRSLLVKKKFTDYIATDFQDAFYFTQLKLNESDDVNNFELKMRNVNGTSFRVQVSERAATGREDISEGHQIAIIDIEESKKNEEDLLLKAQILDSATDAVLLREIDGGYSANFLYVNEAACKMLGFTRNELLNMSMKDLSPWTTPEAMEKRRKRLLEDNENFVEGLLRRKDGTKIPVENHAKIINAGGQKYALSVIRDISERKKTEEKLQLQANMLGAVAEAVITMDLEGAIIYWNKAAERTYGWRSDEVLNRNLGEVLVPMMSQDEASVITSNLLKGDNWSGEFFVKRRDGVVFPVLVNDSPLKDENGKLIGIIGVSRDITERKKMEESLIASEQKFRTLFENAPVGIGITNTDGSRVERNPAQAKIFGFKSREEMMSETSSLYVNPEDRTRYLELAQKGPVGDFVARMKHKDGSFFWVSMSAAPYDLMPGQRQFISIVQDITPQKQAEEELRASREELRNLYSHLQRAMEQERALISREVHDELGQSLTALKMDTVWLEDAVPENRRAVQVKLQSMSKLIDSTIMRVRKVSSELRPGVLDDLGLTAAIEWAVKEFESRTGIKCDFSASPEDFTLDKDLATAVYRISQEVMTNIARHSKASSAVIRIGLDDGLLGLTIEDNGVGISPGMVSSPNSLGLIGIRERVHFFGGEVIITGKPGAGTTVIVNIPTGRNG